MSLPAPANGAAPAINGAPANGAAPAINAAPTNGAAPATAPRRAARAGR